MRYTTSNNLSIFKRLPFGINVASQCFSPTMNNVFVEILHRDCIVLDVNDINVVGNDIKNVLRISERVVNRLQETNGNIITKNVIFYMLR